MRSCVGWQLLSRIRPCTRSETERSTVASNASVACWATATRLSFLLVRRFSLGFPLHLPAQPARRCPTRFGAALRVTRHQCHRMRVLQPRARHQSRMDHAIARAW